MNQLFMYMVETPHGIGVVNEQYDMETFIVTVDGKNYKVKISDVKIIYSQPITAA